MPDVKSVIQGKLDEVGDEGFARFWRDATSTVFFDAAAPCIGGSLSAGPSERFPDAIWKMSLTVHYEPLDETRWRDAIRRLFVAIAGQLPAFYASAEVLRGNIWNGRSLWHRLGTTEWPIVPVRQEGWMGLPPYPVWWAWYGAPYRDLIGSQLSHGRIEAYDRGLLHELADSPLDRDQLADLVTVRRRSPRRKGGSLLSSLPRSSRLKTV